MKLLLDEILSDRIVPHILDLFPESTHIKTVGLAHTDDRTISEWAKQHDSRSIERPSVFAPRPTPERGAGDSSSVGLVVLLLAMLVAIADLIGRPSAHSR